MKGLKRFIKFIFICAVSLLCFWSYIRHIEPNRLDIKEIELTKKDGEQGMGLRIVQFSDTHIGHEYDLEELERLVDKINRQNADLIVFTGDLIDNTSLYEERNEISSVLKALKSKYGKFAIWGNHDYGGGGTGYYETIMEESGFSILKNENQFIELDSGKRINMIGLDDGLLGNPDAKEAFDDIKKADYNILFMHEPDLIDEVNIETIDLALAGHSHGGQISLPFIGPLITPPLAKNYTHGLYELEDDKYLYVNTGIGTTKVGVRFLSVPEVTVFNISL